MGYLSDNDPRANHGVITPAAGPVDYSTTAGTPPPAAPQNTISSFYGDPASGVQIPTNGPDMGGDGSGFSPLEALNNLARPDSPSAQSYRANAGVNVSPAPIREAPLQGFHPAYTPLSSTPPSDAAGAQSVAVPPRQAGVLTQPPATAADYQRQYAAMQANDKQDALDARQRNAGAVDAANASTDLTRLSGEQRVARWNAVNGADVVLGDRGDKEDAAARAARNASAVDADVAAAQGRLANGRAREVGPRNYIDEYGKTQQGLLEAGRAATAGQTGQLDVQGKALDVQSKQQLVTLRAQLANENDPAKRKALQDKILTMEGKVSLQDRVAVVDVDTGQKDMFGQPIYKKAAVDVTTGKLVGGDTAAPKEAGPKKPSTQDDAHAQAKAAIAAGAKADDVNKRLKEWGYATL
jgi:hypothetical protein